MSTPVFDLCLNATICRWVITWVWTELFGPMKAPQNRRKALYPNEPKNKWFNQNIDLFMVKIWSNYGKSEFRIGHFKKMTISSTFFRAFLAHKSSLKSSSWAEFELTKNKFFKELKASLIHKHFLTIISNILIFYSLSLNSFIFFSFFWK